MRGIASHVVVCALGVAAISGAVAATLVIDYDGMPLTLVSDRIQVSNVEANEEIGALVDGALNGVNLNDRSARGKPALEIGNYKAGSRNEVIVFSRRRPPIIQATAWTPVSDNVSVPLPSEIAIDVTVWVVTGNYTSRRATILSHKDDVTAIWFAERVGVRFGAFDIVDATQDPDSPQHALYGDAPNELASMQTNIGSAPNRINIYYVDSVDPNNVGTVGSSWGPDFIALGNSATGRVLAHELGHTFGLAHQSGTGFGTSNVMNPSTNAFAIYLTEGQVFRIHYLPGSALRTVYSARTDLPFSDCGIGPGEDFPGCPSTSRRIWADGPGFPPN